jgi:ATP-dependent exoDNAse (exonuclease V) beta subunit
VVIVPFLDAPIQSNHKTQVWLDTKEMFGETLGKSWISFSKKVENYGAAGIKLVEETLYANELDALNVLYVALTRPVEQLILISNGATSKKDSYPQMIQNYLKQKNAKESEVFTLGQKRQTFEKIKVNEKSKVFSIEQKANPWQKKIKTLAFTPNDFKTNAAEAWGILIHELLSKIEIAEDVDWVIEDASGLGKIELKDKKIFKKILRNIVDHPELKSFYSNDFKVWNERDILVPNGKNIRPDRLVKRNKELILIDYKTGMQKEADHEQLIQYKNIVGQVFTDKKIKCFLVYIKKNDALEVEMV